MGWGNAGVQLISFLILFISTAEINKLNGKWKKDNTIFESIKLKALNLNNQL